MNYTRKYNKWDQIYYNIKIYSHVRIEIDLDHGENSYLSAEEAWKTTKYSGCMFHTFNTIRTAGKVGVKIDITEVDCEASVGTVGR